MGKLLNKSKKLMCNITIAKVEGIIPTVSKLRHKGSLKEEMLKLGIIFGIFAIVSACLIGIATLGSTWGNGQAAAVFK